MAFALAWKTKKLFNYVRLVGKMPFFLRNSFLTVLMLISRKLVQRRGIGEKCVFFRSSPAVTKRLRSKRVRRAFSQRSIFSSWLGHVHKFLLQTTFFSNVCKSLDIPHILVSPITFRSSVLNLVLRPHRVRRNRKESGLAQSRASFCGIRFAPTPTSAFGRYFTITIFRMRCGHDSWNDTDGKTFQSVVI